MPEAREFVENTAVGRLCVQRAQNGYIYSLKLRLTNKYRYPDIMENGPPHAILTFFQSSFSVMNLFRALFYQTVFVQHDPTCAFYLMFFKRFTLTPPFD